MGPQQSTILVFEYSEYSIVLAINRVIGQELYCLHFFDITLTLLKSNRYVIGPLNMLKIILNIDMELIRVRVDLYSLTK